MTNTNLHITSEQLTQTLIKVRKLKSADGSLWQNLATGLNLSTEDLKVLLQNEYGVATISDQEWPDVVFLRSNKSANDGKEDIYLDVKLNGKFLLFCEDPWHADATLALARNGQPGMQLALARPNQMADLLRKSGGAITEGKGRSQPLNNFDNTSPVVNFVDQAISKAYEDGASDIHFETNRSGVSVKYRLDGVMAAGLSMDNIVIAEEVVSRIKVLAQLDITERRRPQDGRFRWAHTNGDAIDLRVSIMPSIFGEDAVLRLLDKAQLRHTEESMSLKLLGFDVDVAIVIRELASRPHGMLLVTGPTGSGKTTTVYAALSEVNDGLEKIITIEDPVEYELPGVLQIPVNEQKGLTFATGLRSILRHDPDKILVGEIRDAETAEIAVQSSLTGHLVFTTVHANSLLDVLGRFQHFGIDPFALASALNGVVVQRLLRKVCPQCVDWRLPAQLEIEKLKSLDLAVPERLPVAVGCIYCRQTGYKGRFVVAEVHQLSDEIRDLLVHKSSIIELKKVAYANKASRLLAHAMTNVDLGVTTLEEVNRAIGLV
jgi:general secretion pathway protein E